MFKWKDILPIICMSLLGSLMFSVPVVADSYDYYVPVSVYYNVSSGSLTNFSALVPINNTMLADYGYIDADGLETSIQEGASTKLHSVAEEYMSILVSSLTFQQTRSYRYLLGYDPALTENSLFAGYGGYVVCDDDASLELGDDFDITFEGYVDTSSEGSIISKTEALTVEVSAEDEITAGIVDDLDVDLNSASMTGLADVTFNDIQVEKLTDNKVVLSYQIENTEHHYIQVGTIDDGEVTWGTVAYLNLVLVENNCCIAVMDEDTVIAFNVLGVYSGYDVYGYVGTVVGDAITFGTGCMILENTGPDLAAARVSDSVVGLHYANSTTTSVIGITISGDTLTPDSAVALTTDDIENFNGNSACWLQDGHTIFGGVNNTSSDTTTIYSIAWSGTTPTKMDTDTQSSECLVSEVSVERIDDTHALFAYQEESGGGYDGWIWTLEYSSFVCTERDSQEINGSAFVESIDVAYMSDNYFLVFFRDGSDSDEGHISRLTFDETTYVMTLDADEHDYTGTTLGAYSNVSGCFYEGTYFITVYRTSAGDSYAITGENNVISYAKSVSASGLTSGEMKVSVQADGTDLKIYIDDVEEDTIALAGASVTDTAFDWNLMDGTTVQQVEYLIIEVGGVQQLWYQPTSMYATSNVPDRSGNGNSGVVVWGTNYPGIELTLGGVYSMTAYVPEGSEGGVTEVFPPPDDLAMHEGSGATGTGLPLEGLYTRMSTSLGWTLPVSYAVTILIFAVAVGFAAFVASGSALGFAIGFGATAGAGGAMRDATGATVFPWWIVIIIVAIIGMAWYSWRRG